MLLVMGLPPINVYTCTILKNDSCVCVSITCMDLCMCQCAALKCWKWIRNEVLLGYYISLIPRAIPSFSAYNIKKLEISLLLHTISSTTLRCDILYVLRFVLSRQTENDLCVRFVCVFFFYLALNSTSVTSVSWLHPVGKEYKREGVFAVDRYEDVISTLLPVVVEGL